ncbi:MAG: DUF2752 domain-containing protein [Micromonosporaceae bacterium]|nr:DUF2752 domain-containing protein [Micromonosporaceae bacterium]
MAPPPAEGDSVGQSWPGQPADPRFVGPITYAPVADHGPRARTGGFFARLAARAPSWSAPLAIAACFAGVASWVLITDPTDSKATDMPSCLVKLTTGLDCPGCGGTRAFYYLLHGNLPQAVRHHAIAVLAAPVLVWLYVAWSVRKITGRRLPVPQLGGRTMVAFLIAWAVFMVVRNIPVEPFTYLYV